MIIIKGNMSEGKDPKIKLFGKTIEVAETAAAAEESGGEDRLNQEPPCSSDSVVEDCNLSRDEESRDESLSDAKQDNEKHEDRVEPLTPEKLKDSSGAQPMIEDSNEPPSADTDAGSAKTSKTEEEDDQSETQEKTLKKPDKILPCPRCNSTDTKFCYFNNYNVNQPRHFCKNCQRYWTAGGTMRNVPVGAGRRKNKNSVSQFQHLTIQEAARVNLPNGLHHSNGTVLTFGSDSPPCESMASVLNIVDKTNRSSGGVSLSDGSKENGDDCRSRSSMTTACSKDDVNKNGLPDPFPQQVPCYSGGPWPYPTFGPAGFPVPFYFTAPPYWGCAVNVPWGVIPQMPPSPGPNSPTLGKHSRDDNILKQGNAEERTLRESNSEKCLWVPKTLRIDDAGEAAKSSIWATLGIKNDRVDSIGGGGGLFKAFRTQSKGDKKVPETSTVLQANPAALSRSLSFHERS